MESPTQIALSWQWVIQEPSSPPLMGSPGLQGHLGLQKILMESPTQIAHFLVVGDSGTILTSSDGTSWNIETSGISYNLKGVTSK